MFTQFDRKNRIYEQSVVVMSNDELHYGGYHLTQISGQRDAIDAVKLIIIFIVLLIIVVRYDHSNH